ncbi:MAG: PPC domain-containing protein [Clostridia bacterium]|nr:PPC domain-containing protein [Clostridia bacterium]
MKRLKAWKLLMKAASIALLILMGVAAARPFTPVFQGIRIRDSHAYVLEIQRMNGNDRHTLELRAGDVVRVAFETEKGFLRLQICAPDGTVIYRGNGRKASSFTLNIAQTGAYTIEVKAKQARGNIRITIKERNQ